MLMFLNDNFYQILNYFESYIYLFGHLKIEGKFYSFIQLL